jgi:hypothetical protein
MFDRNLMLQTIFSDKEGGFKERPFTDYLALPVTTQIESEDGQDGRSPLIAQSADIRESSRSLRTG